MTIGFDEKQNDKLWIHGRSYTWERNNNLQITQVFDLLEFVQIWILQKFVDICSFE